MLRVAIAQIDPVVGAFEANVAKIKEAYQRACYVQARVLITPELGICGYPPYDLMDRPEMIERNEKAIIDLEKITQSQNCALIVGHVGANPRPTGRSAQNVASVLENGRVVFSQAKTLLPTYDVFDEARYFEPAYEIRPWICDGEKIGLAICEDLWSNDLTLGRLYGKCPLNSYKEHKIQYLFSISSSPYGWNKRKKREDLHSEIARELNVPLVYVNQVGATDEILFDGESFVLDSAGNLSGRLPRFQTALGVASLKSSTDSSLETSVVNLEMIGLSHSIQSGKSGSEFSEIEGLADGLVLGIREYFSRSGFTQAVLGLSGGIDSAVVGALAARALGPKNVLGVAMPSQYSSGHSLEDAEILARNLGMRFEVRPIKFLFSTASRELSETRGQLAPIASENLQSRLRGTILMTLANHYSALVLTTGNKSELAMGYCTLYGDMVGALAPIGDLFKTRVYELARFINQKWGSPIPERSLTKAPSAELKPNQTDQDTLPPYDVLDELLMEYIENGISIAELEARFQGRKIGKFSSIRQILNLLEISEFKRRQAAPVLKISHKAFGIGRRIPIAKVWERT